MAETNKIGKPGSLPAALLYSPLPFFTHHENNEASRGKYLRCASQSIFAFSIRIMFAQHFKNNWHLCNCGFRKWRAKQENATAIDENGEG